VCDRDDLDSIFAEVVSRIVSDLPREPQVIQQEIARAPGRVEANLYAGLSTNIERSAGFERGAHQVGRRAARANADTVFVGDPNLDGRRVRIDLGDRYCQNDAAVAGLNGKVNRAEDL